MNRRTRLALSLLLAGGAASVQPAAAAAPATGKQALANMAKSLHGLSYQGTVAFLRQGKLEPMKYFHAVQGGVEQERLLSLNSPLREIIREHGQVSCFYTKTHERLIDAKPFDRSFLVDLPNNLNQLEAGYTITLAGEEEVAMLPAYVVYLKPKDAFRYPRAFWLDKQHFLPLQAIVYGPADETLEQLVFTDFSVHDSLPLAKPQTGPPATLANKPAPLPMAAASFTVKNLPAGFEKALFTRHLMHAEALPVDHLMLSDGLAWVSVYMEHKKAGGGEAADIPASPLRPIGAINFYIRAVGDYEFLVMGDVPMATVKHIADNIRLRNLLDP